MMFFFFFNDTATTEIYTRKDTLSLHDALPISPAWPYTIVADYSSRGGDFANSSGKGTLDVARASQAPVTIGAPTDLTYGDATGQASAAGGSGTGAYSFGAGASTACSINGTTGAITVISGTGTCVLTASRTGDPNFADSDPSAAATVTLHKADPVVTATGKTCTY